MKLSRYLNEKQAFMGLSIEDILIIMFSFTIVDALLSDTHIRLLSFIYLIIAVSTVVTLRFKTRRKIVRDFIYYQLSSKVMYDPKN